jgi:hypothetical protein
MRKSRRRLVIPLVVFALVAAGGLTAGLTLVANAQDSIDTCTASGSDTGISCSITDSTTDTEVTDPSSIEAVVTLNSSDDATTDDQYVQITYQVNCSTSSENETTSNSTDDTFAINTSTPETDTFDLAYDNPASCEVLNVTATLEASPDGGTTFTTTTTGEITLNLEWTPQSAASSSSSTTSSVDVPYIGGFGGKCIDDRGNSSSNGTEVIIWGCNHGDSAQDWTWNSSGELEHDGMCANDPGYGGSGSKLILWSCTGTSNERWSHVTFGRFKLNYSGKGALCLDDPGFSTSNGTRLMVYKCNGGSNQNWSRST